MLCINICSSAHVVVRTKLDGDFKPLAAKSLTISVKCYETRVGRINIVQSNVLVEYTKVLWSKQDGVDYEPIGNLDLPFRISLPAKVAGFSTAAFVDYRCVWRLEAGTTCSSYFFTLVHLIFLIVLNHLPISGIGTRQIRHFELPLIRYDVPSYLPISPPTPPFLNLQTNKPRAPRIRYSIHSPQIPIGPHDLVSVSIHLLPVDHGVSIRSTSIIVERRIQLHDQIPSVSGSTSIPPTPPPYQEDPLFDAVSSTPSLSSTVTPDTALSSLSMASESTPLLPPNSSASTKLVVNPIAGTESSGNLFRDEKGVWSRTLTLQWPAVKSHSLWAVGETISSELVTVKYFVRTKVCFPPAGSSLCLNSPLSNFRSLSLFRLVQSQSISLNRNSWSYRPMKLSANWLSQITTNYITPLFEIPHVQNPNHLDARVLTQKNLCLCHQLLVSILTANPAVDAHIQAPAREINLWILLEVAMGIHVFKRAADRQQQIYLEKIWGQVIVGIVQSDAQNSWCQVRHCGPITEKRQRNSRVLMDGSPTSGRRTVLMFLFRRG